MIALNIDVSALSLNAARRVHTAWASDRAPVPSMGADGSRSDMVAGPACGSGTSFVPTYRAVSPMCVRWHSPVLLIKANFIICEGEEEGQIQVR